ncbi:UNVERIFIED_CONTAM: hypothetical protein NCL1_24885 [Trichonephila clavipes]
MLQPEVVPFLQCISGAVLQQNNARPQMLQRLFKTSVPPNIYNFFLCLLIRQLWRLFSACGIWLVHVSLVSRVLQLQKNFYCVYKQYGNLFYKADIQNLFDSMSRLIQHFLQRVVDTQIFISDT